MLRMFRVQGGFSLTKDQDGGKKKSHGYFLHLTVMLGIHAEAGKHMMHVLLLNITQLNITLLNITPLNIALLNITLINIALINITPQILTNR